MFIRTSSIVVGSFLLLSACGGGDSKSADSSAPMTEKAAATSVDPATAGSISGSIKFTGAKPTPKRISMAADAYCKGAHTGVVTTEEVVVNPNGTLRNVLVYVKSGLEGKNFPASGSVLLDQQGCIYHPHVVAVQANQKLVIQNSDAVLHNVNARPKNNKPFNLGQPVKGMKAEKTFDNPEIGIPVKCDVHPWMKSYINVIGHPYHSVTNDQGSFELKNLPPGDYVIEAWHEQFGTKTANVTVGAKESKTISFTFNG